MQLEQIYRPIEKELIDVGRTIRNNLKNTKYNSILKASNYLLYAGGKRLRPALVLLSAKAVQQTPSVKRHLINVASAIELIHMASLLHDDVIDHSKFRHNKPTINYKWGEDVAIALGDYLYSVAFELISTCGNMGILQCISSATKTMCEGELLQVCERDNLGLLKQHYIVIVKKKTASLFAASTYAGSLISNIRGPLRNTLKEYGLNFGIAFQIIDDYLDLVGEEKNLGKSIGQDIRVGEFTLPILNLLDSVPADEREKIKILLASKKDRDFLQIIKARLFNSGAASKTKEVASSYVTLAKEKINIIPDSAYKKSLLNLADFIMKRAFNANSRKGVKKWR